MKCHHTSIFIETPSLEGLPTKAKEDPSPHEIRLSPAGHPASFSRTDLMPLLFILFGSGTHPMTKCLKEFFPFSLVAITVQRNLAILNSAAFWSNCVHNFISNFITQSTSLFLTLSSVPTNTGTMCMFFGLHILLISFPIS